MTLAIFCRYLKSTLSSLLHCLFATSFLAPCLAGEVVIHLDSQGSDASDGLTEHTAVASLQQALDIAESIADARISSMRVVVAPGEYKGQRAKVTTHRSNREIAIVAADPQGVRPRFNGDPYGGTWLDIRSSTGGRTGYKISGLEITNYETAINLMGDRNHQERSIKGNEIRNNVFAHIGQYAKPGMRPSTAVIRLVNSDDNVIASNHFTHNKNSEKCALLHSIYVAHDSTGNIIEDNVFEDSCGDAVRFRDGSHSNVVQRNTFVDAWSKAPVSDWYCDRERRTDCTKAGTECPSMNNVLDRNKVVAQTLPPVPLYLAFGEDRPSACATHPDGHRFIAR